MESPSLIQDYKAESAGRREWNPASGPLVRPAASIGLSQMGLRGTWANAALGAGKVGIKAMTPS